MVLKQASIIVYFYAGAHVLYEILQGFLNNNFGERKRGVHNVSSQQGAGFAFFSDNSLF